MGTGQSSIRSSCENNYTVVVSRTLPIADLATNYNNGRSRQIE